MRACVCVCVCVCLCVCVRKRENEVKWGGGGDKRVNVTWRKKEADGREHCLQGIPECWGKEAVQAVVTPIVTLLLSTCNRQGRDGLLKFHHDRKEGRNGGKGQWKKKAQNRPDCIDEVH